jgi:general secretion pathway protein J
MKPVSTRGFTLIEMMVALLLISLISVALVTAFRYSQRSLLQAKRVDTDVRSVAVAQRFLRRVLEEAYPFEPVAGAPSRGLQGDAQSLAFSAPAPAADGSVGLLRYSLLLDKKGDDSRQSLIVQWQIDRNGEERAVDAPRARSEVLIEDVKALDIAYLEHVDPRDPGALPEWRNSWTERQRLPALVRVHVEFDPGDRRRWPDLVIAPRITDDANCTFDVVSQNCRAGT